MGVSRRSPTCYGSTPGVFIGYAEASKAYRILDPET